MEMEIFRIDHDFPTKGGGPRESHGSGSPLHSVGLILLLGTGMVVFFVTDVAEI